MYALRLWLARTNAGQKELPFYWQHAARRLRQCLCRFWHQFKWWQANEIGNFSGTMAYASGLLMWATSIAWVRRNYFEASASFCAATLVLVTCMQPYLALLVCWQLAWQRSTLKCCSTGLPVLSAGILQVPYCGLRRLLDLLLHALRRPAAVRDSWCVLAELA